MMKRSIISLSLAAATLWAAAQTPATTYIKVDQTVIEDIIASHVAKAKPADTKEEYLYKGLLEDAFREYVASKKVRADVVEQSVVSQMRADHRKELDEKNAEIKSLSKDNYEQKLTQAKADFEAQLAAQKAGGDSAVVAMRAQVTAKDNVIAAQEGTIESLNEKVNTLTAENEELRKNDAVFKNISEKLNQKRDALADAYRSVANAGLGRIKDFDALRQTGTAYVEFLDVLGQKPSAQEQKQIADIDAVCKAADYYQRAVAQLAKVYDAKANEALINEYAKVKTSTISPMQGTDMARVYEALKDENMVVAAFRNSILGYLRNEGCIPDNQAMKAALAKINENVEIFADANTPAGQFSPLYVEINKTLATLNAGVKGWSKNGYDDPDKFKAFLTKIDASLGGK